MNGLPITVIEGEPRIFDLDLAERLGYARARMLRKLIKRHLESLEELGAIRQMPKDYGYEGGTPTLEFYLNCKQALFVAARSEMPAATNMIVEIIRRFDEYALGVSFGDFQKMLAEATREGKPTFVYVLR